LGSDLQDTKDVKKAKKRGGPNCGFALLGLLLTACLVPATAARNSVKKGPKDGRLQKRGQVEVTAPQGCAGLEDPEEIFTVGMELGKGGLYAESRSCFELYVQLVPDDVRGFNILAEVLARMTNYPESLKAAEKAVSLAPDAPESLFLQASALMALHEYREAREIFSRVLEIDPFHVNSMVNLGSLLGNLNDHTSAVDIYRRVLEIKPDLWQAKHNLGTCLHSLKRFSEAQKLLEEVYRDVPGCFECAMSLANTLRELSHGGKKGGLSASKEMYEEALAMNSGSKEAVLHLYTAMQELVDWDDLDIMLERVVNATQHQLSEGLLPTVSTYHCLLSSFGAPLTLAIAVAHADHAADKVRSIKEEAELGKALLPLQGSLVWGGKERLRVAYIMADWRQHVTAHLLRTVFQRHDARRVTAYAFALNQDDGGSFRRDIRANLYAAN
jgi:tetratricopeptide (TPR) repeat protein